MPVVADVQQAPHMEISSQSFQKACLHLQYSCIVEVSILLIPTHVYLIQLLFFQWWAKNVFLQADQCNINNTKTIGLFSLVMWMNSYVLLGVQVGTKQHNIWAWVYDENVIRKHSHWNKRVKCKAWRDRAMSSSLYILVRSDIHVSCLIKICVSLSHSLVWRSQRIREGAWLQRGTLRFHPVPHQAILLTMYPLTCIRVCVAIIMTLDLSQQKITMHYCFI